MNITDITARDAIIATIKRTPAKRRFATDWTRARYLARREMIVGIVGGFANSVVFSPAHARGGYDVDMLFFYGPAGVLVHEERARGGVEALASLRA